MRKRCFATKLFLLTTLCFALVAGQAPGQGVSKAAGPARSSATTKAQLLDLNTATADQLKTLPGIGDAYAKRIIANRPYTVKNQLASRGIVPQGTYDKIKDSVVAHRAGA